MELAACLESVTTDSALELLDKLIAAHRLINQLHEKRSELFRTLSAAEHEARQCAEKVSSLESKLRALRPRVLIGEVKPGEIGATQEQLRHAMADSDRQSLSAGEAREMFCAIETAVANASEERQKLRDQLVSSLPAVFERQFGQADRNGGVRGAVVWQEDDPYGRTSYRKYWRQRAFQDLFRTIVNMRSDIPALQALICLFSERPFRVRIVSGFVLGSRPFGAIGDVVSVPKELSFEEAFEEIGRRRVVIVAA